MHGWYNFLGCVILDVFESGLWYHYHWKSISRLWTRGCDLVPLICHVSSVRRYGYEAFVVVWICSPVWPGLSGEESKIQRDISSWSATTPRAITIGVATAATATTAIRATTAATTTTSIRATTAATATTAIRVTTDATAVTAIRTTTEVCKEWSIGTYSSDKLRRLSDEDRLHVAPSQCFQT